MQKISELEAEVARLREQVRMLEEDKVAMRKAATDYCWMRYKQRREMMLSHPAVFTSHEWQKIGEYMDSVVYSPVADHSDLLVKTLKHCDELLALDMGMNGGHPDRRPVLDAIAKIDPAYAFEDDPRSREDAKNLIRGDKT